VTDHIDPENLIRVIPAEGRKPVIQEGYPPFRIALFLFWRQK